MPRMSHHFPEISARAFLHPADTAALAAMQKVPGFDRLLRKIMGLVGERSIRLAMLGGAVRVSSRQLPELNRVYEECLAVLDIKTRPELYVTQTPFINAGAIGVDKPIIVLNSAAMGLFDEKELRFILGHELGHILADHVLYKTMFALLLRLGVALGGLSIGMLAISAVSAALAEWDRKSELSSDRAGLLCLQDPEASYAVILKVAGGVPGAAMSVPEFLAQAKEYESGGTELDSFLKFSSLLGIRHPFHAQRLLELKAWVDGGAYAKILGDDYPRRDGDAHEKAYDSFRSSARAYQESFRASNDPLVRFVRDFADEVSEGGAELWDKLKKRWS